MMLLTTIDRWLEVYRSDCPDLPRRNRRRPGPGAT
jgi:hypothetical protein